MTLLTIFSAPKPFTREHIRLIQRNALGSWLQLDGVEVILLGDEEGIAETAHEFGVKHIAGVDCNESGTPRLDSIFRLAEEAAAGRLMAYQNADMIALPDFVRAAESAAKLAQRFLIVGQRWDLDLTRPLDFDPGWDERLVEEARREGRRHGRNGSDYFIYPRGGFPQLPPFALGRAGWDNWMIYAGRRGGVRVVDASAEVNVIHQTHDYGHLPGGMPHYQHPESFNNLHMAGGEKVVFTLDDADTLLAGGRFARPPITWRRFWREVEIGPLVRLKSDFLGELFHLLFHPRKSYSRLRGWLAGGDAQNRAGKG
jgi:hypothetical protein